MFESPKCGSPHWTSMDTGEPPTIVEAPRAAAPWLVVQDLHGKVVHVAQLTQPSMRIGREPGSDLVLAEERVSRVHAVLTWDGTHASVIDQGSVNGTWLRGSRLVANRVTAWSVGSPLTIGSYSLSLSAKSPQASSVLPSRPGVTLALDRQSLELTPGHLTKIAAVVRNTGKIVDEVDLTVEGVPAAWVRATPSVAHLLPDEQARCELAITAPRLPSSQARDYEVVVRARSRADTTAGASVSTRWTVLPFLEPHLEPLVPVRVHSGREARYSVSVKNAGNSAIQFALRATDDEQALQFDFPNSAVELGPGQTSTLTLRLHMRRRLVGRDRTYTFRVVATPTPAPPGPALSARGEFVHQPVQLPLLLLALLLFALLLGLTLLSRNPVVAVVLVAYVGCLAALVAVG